MTAQTEVGLGIALDGITDSVAICADDPTPRPWQPPLPQPHCVIEPRIPGERPLAGDAAFASLDGRGWDENHVRDRYPILPLLRGLDGSESAPGALVPGIISDLLAAHIRALGNPVSGQRVIAVPDTLTELGQQRLLDGLRRGNIPAKLLWRPIATVLGWAFQQPPEQLRTLHGLSVLVVHVGFWAPEVTVISLEVEEHQGRPWLMPIRGGRGLGLADPSAWPIELAAQAILEADLGRVALPMASVIESQVWLNRRPWAVLCGDCLPTEVFRDRLDHWRELTGLLWLPLDQVKPLLGPLLHLLRKEAERAKLVDRVLIEGPLVRLNLGESNLGDRLAQQLMAWLGCGPAAVQVLRPDESTTARGAAHYAWRRRQDIPGYYDTVPELQINACVEGTPRFVSLAAGESRIVGGEAIRPREVPGFSVAAGTSVLDYYLARADESSVRLTRTELPEPPQEQIPIKLIVSQTPGQGFASVEVAPVDGARWPGRRVFLNWNLMDDTRNTKDEVLQALAGQCHLAYPNIEPLSCHAAVWKAYDVPRAMIAYLDCLQGMSQNLDVAPLLALRDVLNKKPTSKSLKYSLRYKFPHEWLLKQLPGDNNKCAVVSSNGDIPSESDLVAFLGPPPQGFGTYHSLYDELLRATGDAFLAIANSADAQGNFHRQLLLIGGWFYSAAPAAIAEGVRQVLRQSTVESSLWTKCAFSVAGRCLTATDDIRILFAKVKSDFAKGGLAHPHYRMEAVRLVLTYREDTALALTSDLAESLAGAVAFVMEEEQQVLANKFFVAATLLMGLLRYRRVDTSFLSPGAASTAGLLGRINKILAQPGAATTPRRVKLKQVFRLMQDFMEARGSPVPIFDILEGIEQ